MTSLNDVHAWLNSPAGHAYQAECGGYSAALSALITANQRETSAAYEFNQERQRNGQDALPASAALMAVRPRGGPSLAGSTDAVKARFRDPGWRLRVGVEEDAGPVNWDPGSRNLINWARAQTGQEPLPA